MGRQPFCYLFSSGKVAGVSLGAESKGINISVGFEEQWVRGSRLVWRWWLVLEEKSRVSTEGGGIYTVSSVFLFFYFSKSFFYRNIFSVS